MKNIILLTSFPPEGGGGGGVNLRSLFYNIPSEKFLWYSSNVDITAKKNWRPEIFRSQFPFHTPGRNKIFLSWIYKYFFLIVELLINFFKLKTISLRRNSELLWIVVDKDNITQYFILAKILRMPYHVSIQDDPEVSLALVGKKMSNIEKLLFKKLLNGALSVDSTSLNMVKYYENKFNLSSVWLTRSISLYNLRLKYEKRKNIVISSTFKLILAGWGDCPDPWPKVLIDALDIFEKKYKLKIELFSFDPSLSKFKSDKVKIMSRMTSAEFEEFIESMHIGYAPDNLNEKYRLFAETSLSVKMLTYLFNCMPSIYHGPKNSSIGDLFINYQAGLIVDTNNPSDLSEALHELCIKYTEYRDLAYKLSEKYFNEDDMQIRLNKILA